MINELFRLDLTKEERYAVESKKNIKLRLIIGNDIYERHLNLIGGSVDEEGILLYENIKITYKNGMKRGISSNTITERKYMGMISNIGGDLEKLLFILKRNGYKIISPRMPISRR